MAYGKAFTVVGLWPTGAPGRQATQWARGSAGCHRARRPPQEPEEPPHLGGVRVHGDGDPRSQGHDGGAPLHRPHDGHVAVVRPRPRRRHGLALSKKQNKKKSTPRHISVSNFHARFQFCTLMPHEAITRVVCRTAAPCCACCPQSRQHRRKRAIEISRS